MQNITQLQKLAQLIAMEHTGLRYQVAEIFQVSERTITNWIAYLEKMDFEKVCYSHSTDTYKVVEGELPHPLLKT
ncbi:MAG TPA: hypothetical protein VJ937_10960 [Salinivirga sp.]|uniref:hypothetical protein n=1 Tax=Salinivirga sp. TaxID=1970192 RepID=UPI002B4A4E2A|nr:hypothetical protein [Salinivirga sp.]HKK59990.1 hypothetical protein [Salinivirga sp.]